MTVAIFAFAPLLGAKAYLPAYALAAGSFILAWLGWRIAARFVAASEVSAAGEPLPRSTA
jgi:hypothetical protein